MGMRLEPKATVYMCGELEEEPSLVLGLFECRVQDRI